MLGRRNIGGAFVSPSYAGTVACICNNKINSVLIPSSLFPHHSYSYVFAIVSFQCAERDEWILQLTYSVYRWLLLVETVYFFLLNAFCRGFKIVIFYTQLSSILQEMPLFSRFRCLLWLHGNLLFRLRTYSHLFAHTYVVISCLNSGYNNGCLSKRGWCRRWSEIWGRVGKRSGS